MNTQTIFTVLSSLISILGLWYLLFWRYHKLCMDTFRQSVFEMRDELFDYAADGNIDFQHPAYGVLRKMMNGFIRFGHHFSAWQGILFVVLTSKEDKDYLKANSFRTSWAHVTRDLDPSVKTQLNEFVSRIETSAAYHFFLSSPLSIFLLIPLVVVSLIRDPDLWREARSKGEEGFPVWAGKRPETSREVSPNGSRRELTHPLKVKQILGEVALLYGEQSPSASTTGSQVTVVTP